jgi:hypothetical protein
MQLDVLLNLDHLVRVNQKGTSQDGSSQMEHFLRASHDTCNIQLGPKGNAYKKICFNSKDPTSGQPTLLGGNYYTTENPHIPDLLKVYIQITSLDGEKYFAESKNSGPTQLGKYRIKTLNAKAPLNAWTKYLPTNFINNNHWNSLL